MSEIDIIIKNTVQQKVVITFLSDSIKITKSAIMKKGKKLDNWM